MRAFTAKQKTLKDLPVIDVTKALHEQFNDEGVEVTEEPFDEEVHPSPFDYLSPPSPPTYTLHSPLLRPKAH
jgi:hypothetical protein